MKELLTKFGCEVCLREEVDTDRAVLEVNMHAESEFQQWAEAALNRDEARQLGQALLDFANRERGGA